MPAMGRGYRHETFRSRTLTGRESPGPGPQCPRSTESDPGNFPSDSDQVYGVWLYFLQWEPLVLGQLSVLLDALGSQICR